MNITYSLILISCGLKLRENYSSNEKKLFNEKYFFQYLFYVFLSVFTVTK